MQNNGEPVLPLHSLTQDEGTSGQYSLLKEEHKKLFSENEALKENLTKEKFYHQNLYNQWSKLNIAVIDKNRRLEQLRATQNPKLKIYQYAFYALLLLNLLLIIFYFSSTKTGNRNAAIARMIQAENAGDAVKTNSSPGQGQAVKGNIDTIRDKEIASPNFKEIRPLPVNAVSKSPLKYVVTKKSYFHNKPDRSTRRQTFVLPWKDAYGVLTALDDQNGFIYVVFTNHKGRVSKGWILKSDLELLKE